MSGHRVCLRIGSLLLVLFAGICAGAGAASAHDFYAGKRLTVLINNSAGGPSDIDGRVFARHIGKHIPGQPLIIVQNMDGAGGNVAVYYTGEAAPRDGSVLSILTGSAFAQATVPQKGRFDFKTLEFVAAQPSTSVYYIRKDVKPGIEKATDLARAEGVIIGGLGVDISKDILLRLSLDVLGVPHKYVTGYRGTNAVRLAIQQSEVNMTSESPPAYRGVVAPGLAKEGVVIPLYYDPTWDGTSFGIPKEVADLAILPFQELYRQAKGQAPSGPIWESYKTVLGLTGNMFRLLALPPGSPKAAQEALRVAISRLAGDREYVEDAMKSFGYVPSYDTGADLAPRLRAALTTTPETQAFFAAYIDKVAKPGVAGSEVKK